MNTEEKDCKSIASLPEMYFMGCVRFAWYCRKMYSRHFFPTQDCFSTRVEREPGYYDVTSLGVIKVFLVFSHHLLYCARSYSPTHVLVVSLYLYPRLHTHL